MDTMKTRQQTIYSYSELTGAAKERARLWIDEGMWESTKEELRERFKDMLTEAGFPKAEVEFGLSYAQGDGVTFRLKHPSIFGRGSKRKASWTSSGRCIKKKAG